MKCIKDLNIIGLIGVFSFLLTCTSSAQTIQTDPSLPGQIEKLVNQVEDQELLGDEWVFFRMQDLLNGKVPHEAPILELAEYAQLEKKNIPGICNCQLTGDSIIIRGGIGYNDWIYFVFIYHEKSGGGEFTILDETKSVASDKTDTTGMKEVNVKLIPDAYVFAAVPKMKPEEVIYVRIKGKTGSFFELADGKWVERKMEINALVKCTLASDPPR